MNQIKKELEALEVQMISALHLLWIIPLTGLCMAIVIGVMVGANTMNKEYEAYQDGFKEGYDRAMKELEKHK